MMMFNFLSYGPLVQDTPNSSGFTTTDVAVGITMGIALGWAFIIYYRRNRTVCIFVHPNPEDNMTCPEIKHIWFFKNFHVIVVESATNAVLGHYFLLSQLNSLLVTVERLFAELTLIEKILEIDYTRTEGSASSANQGPGLSRHDQSIILLNNDIRKNYHILENQEYVYDICS